MEVKHIAMDVKDYGLGLQAYLKTQRKSYAVHLGRFSKARDGNFLFMGLQYSKCCNISVVIFFGFYLRQTWASIAVLPRTVVASIDLGGEHR